MKEAFTMPQSGYTTNLSLTPLETSPKLGKYWEQPATALYPCNRLAERKRDLGQANRTKGCKLAKKFCKGAAMKGINNMFKMIKEGLI